MGPSRFTSHPKEGVLRIFIALKNHFEASYTENVNMTIILPYYHVIIL
jgi:hypothetical protein